MARQAAKKTSAANAATLKVLQYGFLVSNTVHLLLVFGLFRSTHATKWNVFRFGATEILALALWYTLSGMARTGDDLAQGGLTAYMFDIIYVTWFVHVGTAILGSWLWWTYLVVPGYAVFIVYTKLIVPFLLGGRDPLRGLLSIFTGSKGGNAKAPAPVAVQPATGESVSKRQAKLQKRTEKGDPRITQRQR